MPKNCEGGKTIKSANGRSGGTSLNAYVKLFPAPGTRGFTNKGSLQMLADICEDENEFMKMAYRANKKKKQSLWPTPRANSGNGAGKHGEGGLDLQTAVKLWPAPRTAGMCGGTGNWEQLKNKCADIEEARKMGAGNGGRLSADWVERLMGFPDGWTDIDKDGIDAANRYPAAWRDGSWDTIPRLAVRQKNRRTRIRALGNAVVPQIPAYLWALAAETLWR